MDQAPADIELRNIIDKLAQFVARNGQEFEQMTKAKQQDNPKFAFLFGGEYHNYYQYKVTTEQAIIKQKGIIPMQNVDPRLNISQQQQQEQLVSGSLQQLNNIQNNGLNSVGVMPGMSNSMVVNPVPSVIGGITQPAMRGGPPPGGIVNGPSPAWLQNELANLEAQKKTLQEQVIQSEQNLAAQHGSLMVEQQLQVEDAVRSAKEENLQTNALKTNTDLEKLEFVLKPAIDSCTKDSISAAKTWIMDFSTTRASNQVVADYLLQKVVQLTDVNHKLHIVYLLNDVLANCVRKGSTTENVRKAMETVVVPMFCNASLAATGKVQEKLNKLLNIWDEKKFFIDDEIIDKLKNPSASWSEYQANLVAQYANDITPITLSTKSTYDNYQAQHQAFVNHATRQITNIDQQKIAIEQQLKTPPPQMVQNQQNMSLPTPLTGLPPPIGGDLNFSQPPPGWGVTQNVPQQQQQQQQPQPQQPSLPLPFATVLLPDFSKPPPGFGPPTLVIHEPSVEDLMPSMPYFELPAGLMVPLIKLEDGEYRPLDPDSIRLPPPAPPSERLVAAVEAFYALPNHDSPRDSDGWEKLGLYEYYKAKNSARKRKEDDILSGIREKTRSPSPILRQRSKSPSPPKKRYKSKSRSRSRSRSRGRSKSKSPVSSSSSSSNNRRNSRSSSQHNTNTINNRNRRRRNSNKDNKSPERRGGGDRSDRSPTPPSFLGSTYSKGPVESSLDESNKGHQLLKKMGWGGAGLGANEQGIEAPISGGEIRDRNDQYKGVGINLNDPYENFRKSKGQAFITRMKARAEERAEERGDRE